MSSDFTVYKAQADRVQELEQQLTEVYKENVRFRKLFWLAMNDVIFFSSYNEAIDNWDDDWHPCLNVNDFFLPGADAEGIPDKDMDRHIDTLVELYKRFDHMGSVAWTSMRRNELGPWKGLSAYEPEDVAKFEAAKVWLKETGLFKD